MIDVIILDAQRPFATVGQQHPGLVGVIQNKVLQCLNCLWFDRNETKDREIVSKKIKEHISDEKNNPLLIFPEGNLFYFFFIFIFYLKLLKIIFKRDLCK